MLRYKSTSCANDLRDEEMYKMEGKGDFLTSVYYLDLIAELERMGDYIINVSSSSEIESSQNNSKKVANCDLLYIYNLSSGIAKTFYTYFANCNTIVI